MKKKTILVTSASGMGYPSLVRCFDRKNFTIIGTDSDKNAVGFAFVDKKYQVSKIEDPKYVSNILEICKKERVNVVLPVNPKELIKIASSKNDFESIGTKLLISSLKSIKQAEDKERLFLECEKNKIPAPKFTKVSDSENFKKAVFAFGYPKREVCFKPNISSGSRGFRILSKNKDKFNSLFYQQQESLSADLSEVYQVIKSRKIPEMLVMEYLPGKEYSVDVLASNGKAEIIIPRIREKIVLGASFVGTTVNHKEIIEYSKKITEIFSLHGVIGIQFKEDEKGVPKVLEINPRMQGALILTAASGANLPELSVKSELNMQWKKPTIKWGTKLIRYYDEVYQDKNGKFFRI